MISVILYNKTLKLYASWLIGRHVYYYLTAVIFSLIIINTDDEWIVKVFYVNSINS